MVTITAGVTYSAGTYFNIQTTRDIEFYTAIVQYSTLAYSHRYPVYCGIEFGLLRKLPFIEKNIRRSGISTHKFWCSSTAQVFNTRANGLHYLGSSSLPKVIQ